jgi:hypothetical protein
VDKVVAFVLGLGIGTGLGVFVTGLFGGDR